MSRIYLPNYCEIYAYWNKVYPFISSDWNTLERRVEPSVGGGVETQVFLCAADRSIDWYSQLGGGIHVPNEKVASPDHAQYVYENVICSARKWKQSLCHYAKR